MENNFHYCYSFLDFIFSVAWRQLWAIDKKTAQPTTGNEAAYPTYVHHRYVCWIWHKGHQDPRHKFG